MVTLYERGKGKKYYGSSLSFCTLTSTLALPLLIGALYDPPPNPVVAKQWQRVIALSDIPEVMCVDEGGIISLTVKMTVKIEIVSALLFSVSVTSHNLTLFHFPFPLLPPFSCLLECLAPVLCPLCPSFR
jgi:hypothetical protein